MFNNYYNFMKTLSLVAAAGLLTSCTQVQNNNYYDSPSIAPIRARTCERASGILVGTGVETQVYGTPVELVRETEVIYVQ